MKKKGDVEFILDYGCTQDVTNNLEHSTTVMSIDLIRVHLGNNRVVESRHYSKISIDMSVYKNSSNRVTRLVLSKCLYIPDASVSNTSCNKFDICGISKLIEDSKCAFVYSQDKISPTDWVRD